MKIKHDKRILMVLVAVFFVVIGVQAFAQTVEEVAAENDAQSVDIATVDQRSNNNSQKVTGVEQRLTAVEAVQESTGIVIDATISNHETRLTQLEQQPQTDPTVSSRLAAVEAESASQAARITSLESGAGGFTMYDSAGQLVGSWQSRLDVGKLLLNLGGVEIWARFDENMVQLTGLLRPTQLRFRARDAINYTPARCVQPYVVADALSHQTFDAPPNAFGGTALGFTDPDGNVMVMNDSITEVEGGGFAYYIIDNRGRCTSLGDVQPQRDVYRFVNAGQLTLWHPPFYITSQ